MLVAVIRHELQYWLKSRVFYSFAFGIFLISFLSSYSASVTFIPGSEAVVRPSAYLIYGLYGYLSLFVLLFANTFVASAALRDSQINFISIIQATPITAATYYRGKLVGSILICFLISLGITIGIAVGQIINSTTALDNWLAHVYGIIAILIPAVIVIGSVSFLFASWSRSAIATFLASATILMFYNFSLSLIGKLEYEPLARCVDLLGLNDFLLSTKYWTLEEKNHQLYHPGLITLAGRLLATGVVLLTAVVIVSKLKFGRTANKSPHITNSSEPKLQGYKLKVRQIGTIKQWLTITNIYLKTTLRSAVFLGILALAVLNVITSLSTYTEGYQMRAYPQAFLIAQSVSSNLNVFIYAVLILFSGNLIWAEREYQIDSIVESSPGAQQLIWAKLTSISGLIVLIQLAVMLIAFCYHLMVHKQSFTLGPYVIEFLLIPMARFLPLINLIVIVQLQVNNKYIGYLLSTLLLLLLKIGLPSLNITSFIIRPGELPFHGFSEMNGYGPYLKGIVAYSLFWISTSVFLTSITPIFDRHSNRQSPSAFLRKRITWRYGFCISLILGGYIFFQTQIKNGNRTLQSIQNLSASYELNFSEFRNFNQPRIVKATYKIVNEEKSTTRITGSFFLRNQSDNKIDTLLVTFPRYFTVNILNNDLKESVRHEWFRIYRLASALMPDDTMSVSFTSVYQDPGLENETPFVNVIENGSFFTNAESCPSIGYQPELELVDSIVRKQLGLNIRRHDHNRSNNVFTNNADSVEVQTEFIVPKNHLAVAPGELIAEGSSGNTNLFLFKTKQRILNTYAFLSGNYTIQSRKIKGIELQVYHHSSHSVNIDTMLDAMEYSLHEFEQYGAYPLSTLRLVEFPAYRYFASSFLGVIPFSEGVGFTANLNQSPLDMVTYVVAHEMAHQWWGNQIAPADSSGAFLLTETIAQLGALMVFKSLYGDNQCSKVMEIEEDKYLRERAYFEGNPSLASTEEGNSIIYYQKGAVCMARLNRLIGSDSLTAALKCYYQSYKHSRYYPTSPRLVDLILQKTLPDLREEVKDIFYGCSENDIRLSRAFHQPGTDPKEIVVDISQENVSPTSIEIAFYDEAHNLIELSFVSLTRAENTLSVLCRNAPSSVVLDPHHLLIDPNRANNVMGITSDNIESKLP